MKRTNNMNFIGSGKNYGGIKIVGGRRDLNDIGLYIGKSEFGIVSPQYGICIGIAGTTVQEQLDSLTHLKGVIGHMESLHGISNGIAGTSKKIASLTGINGVVNTVNKMLTGGYSGRELEKEMGNLVAIDKLIGQVNSKLNCTGIFKDMDSQLAYLGAINEVIGQTTSKLGTIGIGTLGVDVNPEFSDGVFTGFNVKLTPIAENMGIAGI